jgi:hypothetical protein
MYERELEKMYGKRSTAAESVSLDQTRVCSDLYRIRI